jgi:hypothetical protein
MRARAAAKAGRYHSAAPRARCQLGRLAWWPLAAGQFGFEGFAGDAGEVGEFRDRPLWAIARPAAQASQPTIPRSSRRRS